MERGGALGAAPARPELLATTGVFDPTRIPPERESSSSFNRLVYLDRLEKLLEAEAERKEQDSPAEPADGDAGGE